MTPIRRICVPALALTLVLIPFVLLENSIGEWAQTSISDAENSTIALISIALLAGDMVLPTPSSLISLAAGGALGFWLGTVTIWVGMTLGCLIGWTVGRGLISPLSRRIAPPPGNPSPDRGVLGLVLCRPIPVLAETSVLVAAARGMRLRTLMSVTGVANLPIAFLYGYFGASFLGEVPPKFFLVAVLIACLLGLPLRHVQRRTVEDDARRSPS